jgi:hypothetical protein
MNKEELVYVAYEEVLVRYSFDYDRDDFEQDKKYYQIKNLEWDEFYAIMRKEAPDRKVSFSFLETLQTESVYDFFLGLLREGCYDSPENVDGRILEERCF